MSNAKTVGELPDGAIVHRVGTGRTPHLDPTCRGLTNALGTHRYRAETLWDDLEICRYCRNEAGAGVGGNPSGGETLPMEVAHE